MNTRTRREYTMTRIAIGAVIAIVMIGRTAITHGATLDGAIANRGDMTAITSAN